MHKINTVGNPVNFFLQLEGVGNRSIPLNLPNTTTMKQISHILCKRLNMDRFNTKIEYFGGRRRNPLSDICSLRQVPVNTGDKLFARIQNTIEPNDVQKIIRDTKARNHKKYLPNPAPFLDPSYGRQSSLARDPCASNAEAFATAPLRANSSAQARAKTSVAELFASKLPEHRLTKFDGVTVQAYCNNIRCLNYKTPKLISLGFSSFNLKNLLSLKCEICPHKDISYKPMILQGVFVKNCQLKAKIESKEGKVGGTVAKRIEGVRRIEEILGGLQQWDLVTVSPLVAVK